MATIRTTPTRTRTSTPTGTPRRIRHRKVGMLVAALATLALCALADPTAALAKKKGNKSDRIDAAKHAASLLSAPLPEIPGPRRTVAVMKFTARHDFLRQYGLSDVGGGLTAMLTTALVESGRFIVLERANLGDAFAEQELGASGLVTNESAARVGAVTGAQWIVTGAVTEFSAVAKGRGFSIGLGGLGGFGGKRDKLGVGLSPQSKRGIVGVDVRVIDAATSEVVAAFHVRKDIKSKGLKVSLDYDDVSLGGNNFIKTPLGVAARAAINDVAQQFAGVVAREAWSGQVVDFTDGEIAINAGGDAGVRDGDTFRVYRVTKVLTDPATGQTIGRRTKPIGRVVIGGVESQVAFGSFEPTADGTPRRGDVVVAPTR